MSQTNVTNVGTTVSDHSVAIDIIPFLPWNNPNNIITYSTFRDVQFVFSCVLDPLLWVLGVSTNVINCVVFFRQGLKDRMNLCLFRSVPKIVQLKRTERSYTVFAPAASELLTSQRLMCCTGFSPGQ